MSYLRNERIGRLLLITASTFNPEGGLWRATETVTIPAWARPRMTAACSSGSSIESATTFAERKTERDGATRDGVHLGDEPA